MKKKELWYGHIPEIFGYGMSVISESKAGAMKALRKRHSEWVKNARSPYDHVNNFQKSFEYFGGHVGMVELDKVYHDDFND